MTFQQYLLVLKARSRIVLWVLLAIVGLTVLVSLAIPRTYTSSAAVLVDIRNTDPMGGVSVAAGFTDRALQSYLATQVEVISSERAAKRVIKALKLDQDPVLKAEWESSKESGQGTFDNWLAESMRKRLVVKPLRDSSIITVTYKSGDMKTSVEAANAFAQAYADIDLDMKVDPARGAVAWVDERAAQLRKSLADAQSKLSEYERKNGIVVGADKVDLETTKLAELSAQLTLAQSASADSAARAGQAGRGAAMTEVLSSPLIQGLKSEVAKQEGKLKDLSTRLGPNHPQYIQAQAELNAVRAKLNAEMGQLSSSVSTANAVNQAREGQLRATLESQRAKVLDMKKRRDEASVLLREVENAQKAYDMLMERASKIRLDSQANQTNVSIVDRATAESSKVSPNLKINLMLSIVLGALLGAIAALVAERMDRRVRNEADLAEVLHLPPVIGILEHASTARQVPYFGQVPRLLGVDSAAK